MNNELGWWGSTLFIFYFSGTIPDHSEVLFILFAILKEEKRNVKYTFWYESKQQNQETIT